MAPPAADVDVDTPVDNTPVPTKTIDGQEPTAPSATTSSASRLTGPLEYSGTLDSYESFDTTSVIGREFPKVQLSEILDDDAKIRDLAITGSFPFTYLPFVTNYRGNGTRLTNTSIVSQRGVVFFRNQDLNIDDQKHESSLLS